MHSNRRNIERNFPLGFYLGGGVMVFILAFIFRPFTIVNAGERGVVMQFGKVQDRVLDEGIHPIMPVITSVRKLNVIADSTYAEFFSFQFFYMSAHINLMLFLFNLLPIPPLDGFYIFSEIFPILKPLQYTYFGLFALMMLFLIPEFGDGLSAIAVFILQTVL
ncbi:hypothetical protein CI592_20370 [Fischerella thermalis CCMEE 5328]|nr:hypothetical protein CI592_20370 [Fischerella thermalis CCMEE 5328]